MEYYNLTKEPEFGEEFKDTLLKLKVIKAIMEGGDWGKNVLKFVDPNIFSVQVGGLHFLIGIIKEQFLTTSKIPSIEEVKEILYGKYSHDDIDKENFDAVFNEYDKIHLSDDDIQYYKKVFSTLNLNVALRKIKDFVNSMDFNESETDINVNRIVKLLEDLKFYSDSVERNEGVEIVKEWD